MTSVAEGRVLCDERAFRCRCFKDAGHVEADDPVHECDPRRCTGAWTGTTESEETFGIVRLPFPVGTPEPWGDEG